MHSRGLSASIIFHSILVLLMAFGLPMFFKRDTTPQPLAISVEVLPIKDISNIRKSTKPVKKATPKPTKKKTPPKPKPVVKEKPTEKPDAVPVPTKDKVKPKQKPKPKPKPKKKTDDAFDQLLKDLTENADSTDAKKPVKKPTQDSVKSRSDHYDPTIPLSISETDAIRSQIMKNWRMPAGVKDDYTLQVEVRVLVNRDGSVKHAEVIPSQQGRYRSDPIFRAAADSALRAVELARPLKNLNPAKYETWKDMFINFDPKDMLY